MSELDHPNLGGNKDFGRNYDGRVGTIVCSECLEDKNAEEIEQVKNKYGYRVYKCRECRGDES